MENGADRKAVCLALCRHMTDEDSEAVTIIYGANASADEAQAIAGELEESFADCDFMVHDGKQEVYSYIISVESL